MGILMMVTLGFAPMSLEIKNPLDRSSMEQSPELLSELVGKKATGSSDKSDSQNTIQSPPPSIWWNQYHSNWYRTGYAATSNKLDVQANSALVNLGSGTKVTASPIVTSQKAIAKSSVTSPNEYGYNYDLSGVPWQFSNSMSKQTPASDGTYFWDMVTQSSNVCLEKHRVSDGWLELTGQCWATSTITRFSDLTYVPVYVQNPEPRIYVLVDFTSSNAKLYAFHALTLAPPSWSPFTLTDHISYGSPVVLPRTDPGDSNQIIIIDVSGKLYKIRASSGNLDASLNLNKQVIYSPSLDGKTYGFLYVITSDGTLIKYDVQLSYSFTEKWRVTLSGCLTGSYASVANAGDWAFVKCTKQGTYWKYNVVYMIQKTYHQVSSTEQLSDDFPEYNTENLIYPSIAVTDKHVFSPRVHWDYTISRYRPGIDQFEYSTGGFVFTGFMETRCQNSPATTITSLAQDSSPAIIFNGPTSQWYLYYTWYYNNGGGNPGMCRFPLVP